MGRGLARAPGFDPTSQDKGTRTTTNIYYSRPTAPKVIDAQKKELLQNHQKSKPRQPATPSYQSNYLSTSQIAPSDPFTTPATISNILLQLRTALRWQTPQW